MKILKLLFFLILIMGVYSKTFCQSQAQKAKTKYNYAQIVKTSKLMVILSDEGTSIDDSIKSAMKKYWTFCDYDFIKNSEYQEYYKKDGYAELGLFKTFSANSDMMMYASYQIVLCHKNTYKYAYSDKVDEVQLPDIKNKNIELNTYNYLIPYIISKLQADLEQNYNSKGVITEYKKDKIHDNMSVYYTEGGYDKLQNMKLIICKDGVKNIDQAKENIGKIMKKNTSEIEFATSCEIYNIINAKKENTAIIYADHSGYGQAFSSSDYKPLASIYGMWIYK